MSQSRRFSIEDILTGSSREGDSSSAEPGSASRRPPLEDNFDDIITDTVSSLVNGVTKNRTDELMEWIEEKRLERMARGSMSRRLAPRVPEKLRENTNISRTAIIKYEDSSDDECAIVKINKRSIAQKPAAGPVISPMVQISPQALLKAHGKGAELCDCVICGGGRKPPPITLSNLGSAARDTETAFDPSKVRKTYSARKRLTTEQPLITNQPPATGEGQGMSVAGQETVAQSRQVSAPVFQREFVKELMIETQYKKWKKHLLRAIDSGCFRLDDLKKWKAIAIPMGVGDIYGDVWFKKVSIASVFAGINPTGTEPFCIPAQV